MKTEIRFLLAIVLMLGVLVGTNLLFPPTMPEGPPPGDSTAVPGAAADVDTPAVGPSGDTMAPALPEDPDLAAGDEAGGDPELPAEVPPVEERRVVVEGPLWRYEFSTVGARVGSIRLPQFEALNRDGVVELVPEELPGYFGHQLVVGADTIDLTRAPFEVEPRDGFTLGPDDPTGTLTFRYQHPTGRLGFDIRYTFHADRYQVDVDGSVRGLDRPLLLTDIGDGLAYAEADSAEEARMMAYVTNHLREGIESTSLDSGERGIIEGPLLWIATRSKFFVMAMLAGVDGTTAAGEGGYLGGLILQDSPIEGRTSMWAAQTVSDGTFAYRLFLGPQEYARLSSLGQGMEEVNPYGWRFFRPIIRPFVSIITSILVFLHTNLNLGYGWVLILFGILMRIVLFPLNHKAMKAQLRNMAVQPLVQEIQAKHKDNPEKLQKEMMRLYKEHGFNPFAGCLPMLLPWPVLIALFFVFQNTIELRGVEFFWIPDLSAKDPLYILPIMLAVSMFLMQWVSLKSLDQPNPQMKMMMWIMPGMMLFIFLNLASGLNLYYATANIATIPQQIWIARERQKMRGKPPPKLARR